MSLAAPHHEGGDQKLDSNESVLDIERINDEELLKNLWQESHDLGERRRIRERMFKVRQTRLQMITQDDDNSFCPDDSTGVARLSADADYISEEKHSETCIVELSSNETKPSYRESHEIMTMNPKDRKSLSSDEEIIEEHVKSVSKGRTARYEEALFQYGVEDAYKNDKISVSQSNYSAQSSTLKSANYQSMKQTEIRDSVSPTRCSSNRNAAIDEEENLCNISDEEIQLKIKENYESNFAIPLNVCPDNTCATETERKISRETEAFSTNKNINLCETAELMNSPEQNENLYRKNLINAKTNIGKSSPHSKKNIVTMNKAKFESSSVATEIKGGKTTSPNLSKKSERNSSSNLDRYIDKAMDDEVIIKEEHETMIDERGNDINLTIQTSQVKDGQELIFRRLAKSIKIVDNEEEIDEILVGNRDHEVISQVVQTIPEEDGSKVKIIKELRKRPDGIEYETKNVLKISKVLELDHSSSVEYDEADEILDTNEITELDEDGGRKKIVTETRRNSKGLEYIIKKTYQILAIDEAIQSSDSDEVLSTEEVEEEQEDGSMVKIIKEKRKTQGGKEYFHRYVHKSRKMTLSLIDLQDDGIPCINNDDVVVNKSESFELDSSGEQVKVVTETRRREDGSVYSFDYVLRHFKAEEKNIDKLSKVNKSSGSNINVNEDDELLNEDIKETVKNDGTIIKTVIQRRRTKDNVLYLRQQIMTIPKLPEPELLIGSLSDEIIEDDIKEKILDDGTRFKSVTERRRSSTSGVHYTLRRMSTIFQHDREDTQTLDEIIDENVTEEETNDGVIIKTIIRRYQHKDGNIYSTHDVQKLYTHPIPVHLEKKEKDELLDRSYEEESCENGFVKKIIETRCRNDGTHYTVEIIENFQRSNINECIQSGESPLTAVSAEDKVIKYEEHDEPIGDGMVCKTITELRRRQDGTEYTNKTIIKSANVLVPEYETSYVVITSESNEEHNSLFPSPKDEIVFTRTKTDYDVHGNKISINIETRKSKSTGELYNLTKKVHTTDILITDHGMKEFTKSNKTENSSNSFAEESRKTSYINSGYENKEREILSRLSKDLPNSIEFAENVDAAIKGVTHKIKSTKTEYPPSPHRFEPSSSSDTDSSRGDSKHTKARQLKSNTPISRTDSIDLKKIGNKNALYTTNQKYSIDNQIQAAKISTQKHDHKILADQKTKKLKNTPHIDRSNIKFQKFDTSSSKRSEKEIAPFNKIRPTDIESRKSPPKYLKSTSSFSNKTKPSIKMKQSTTASKIDQITENNRNRPSSFIRSNIVSKSLKEKKEPIVFIPETPVTDEMKSFHPPGYPLIEEITSDSYSLYEHSIPSCIQQTSMDTKTYDISGIIEESAHSCDNDWRTANKIFNNGNSCQSDQPVQCDVNSKKKLNLNKTIEKSVVEEPVCVKKYFHPLGDKIERKIKIDSTDRKSSDLKTNSGFSSPHFVKSPIKSTQYAKMSEYKHGTTERSRGNSVEKEVGVIDGKIVDSTSVNNLQFNAEKATIKNKLIRNTSMTETANYLTQFTKKVESITDIESLESLLTEVESYDERKIVRSRIRALKKYAPTGPKSAVPTKNNSYYRITKTTFKKSSPRTEYKCPNVVSSTSASQELIDGKRSYKEYNSQKNSRELSERKVSFDSAESNSSISSRNILKERKNSKEFQEFRQRKSDDSTVSLSKGSGTPIRSSLNKNIESENSMTNKKAKGYIGETFENISAKNRKPSTDSSKSKDSTSNLRKISGSNEKSYATHPSSARRKLSFETEKRRMSTSRESTPIKEIPTAIEKRKLPEKQFSAITKINNSPSAVQSSNMTTKKESTKKLQQLSNKREDNKNEKELSVPLRHQRIGKAVSHTKTDVEKVISPYGVGPTDEKGLPLIGLKALKKKDQTVRTVSEKMTDESRTDSKANSMFGLHSLKKNQEKNLANMEMVKEISSKNGEVVVEKAVDTFEKENTPVYESMGRTDVTDPTGSSKKFKDIIKMHESKMTIESFSPDIVPQKPVKALRDSFQPVNQQKEEGSIQKTWDLEADLKVRSNEVENIIAKHENFSTYKDKLNFEEQLPELKTSDYSNGSEDKGETTDEDVFIVENHVEQRKNIISSSSGDMKKYDGKIPFCKMTADELDISTASDEAINEVLFPINKYLSSEIRNSECDEQSSIKSESKFSVTTKSTAPRTRRTSPTEIRIKTDKVSAVDQERNQKIRKCFNNAVKESKLIDGTQNRQNYIRDKHSLSSISRHSGKESIKKTKEFASRGEFMIEKSLCSKNKTIKRDQPIYSRQDDNSKIKKKFKQREQNDLSSFPRDHKLSREEFALKKVGKTSPTIEANIKSRKNKDACHSLDTTKTKSIRDSQPIIDLSERNWEKISNKNTSNDEVTEGDQLQSSTLEESRKEDLNKYMYKNSEEIGNFPHFSKLEKDVQHNIKKYGIKSEGKKSRCELLKNKREKSIRTSPVCVNGEVTQISYLGGLVQHDNFQNEIENKVHVSPTMRKSRFQSKENGNGKRTTVATKDIVRNSELTLQAVEIANEELPICTDDKLTTTEIKIIGDKNMVREKYLKSELKKESLSNLKRDTKSQSLNKGTENSSTKSTCESSTTISSPSYMKPRRESLRPRTKPTFDRSPSEIENLLLNSNQYTRCTKRIRKSPVHYDYTYIINTNEPAAGTNEHFSVYFGPRDTAPQHSTNVNLTHNTYEGKRINNKSTNNTQKYNARDNICGTENENVYDNIRKEYQNAVRIIDQKPVEIGHGFPDHRAREERNIITNQETTHINEQNDSYSSFQDIKQQYKDTVKHISDEIQSKHGFHLTPKSVLGEDRTTEDFYQVDYEKSMKERSSSVDYQVSTLPESQKSREDNERSGTHCTLGENEYSLLNTEALSRTLTCDEGCKNEEIDYLDVKDKYVYSNFKNNDKIQREHLESLSKNTRKENFYLDCERLHDTYNDKNNKTSFITIDGRSVFPPSKNQASYQLNYDNSKERSYKSSQEITEEKLNKFNYDVLEKRSYKSCYDVLEDQTCDTSHYNGETSYKLDHNVNEIKNFESNYDVNETKSHETSRNFTENRTNSYSTDVISSSRENVYHPETKTSDLSMQESSIEDFESPLRPLDTSARGFLDDRTKVSGITDVLSRMGVNQNADSPESNSTDQKAKSLLNKFLGAQILMTGVESMISETHNSQSSSYAHETKHTSNCEVESQEISNANRPSNYNRSSSFSTPYQDSPLNVIKGVNTSEVSDSNTLNQLLNSCAEYEERRRVRQRIKSLTAEKRELQEKLKGLDAGDLNFSTENAARGSSGLKTTNAVNGDKKSVSAFEKFRHLENMNKKGQRE